MITGTNREYIEKHIPHLSSRIVPTLDQLVEHSEILLITRDGEQLLDRVVALGKRPAIIDLRGQSQLAKKLLEAKKRAKPAASEEHKESNGLGRRMLVSLKEQGSNGKAKQICKS
jgi:hypothetical protein